MNNPRQARLNGTLWSDARGRYEFLTVEPGHYAEINPPPSKHTHVHLEPPGLPDHWVDSFKFEGDRYLTSDDAKTNKELGERSAVLRLIKNASGMLQARRDFRIDAALAERNRLVKGWYRQ